MVLESPSDPKVQVEVDKLFKALRASQRPLEYISGNLKGGHYGIFRSTGLTTVIAAGGALFSARWLDSDRLFVLMRILAYAVVDTAFTTAQEVSVNLVRTTNAVADDSGGTGFTINEGGRKHRAMSPSKLSGTRIATTAALGAGAGVVEESESHRGCILPIGNAVGSSARETLYDIAHGAEHPFFLQPLEGFRIRNHFTQGAVGVVRFSFAIDWAEIPLALLT